MSTLFSHSFRQIWDALAVLRGRIDAKPTQTQGRITSIDPVRVQLDTDSSPSPLTPRVINGPVYPGDRVTVLHTKHDLTVIGVVGRGLGTPWRMAAGTIIVPFNGAWNDVAFPAGRFTVAPNCSATIADGAGVATGATVRFLGDSPTSGRLHVRKPDTTGDVLVHWQAVQMTPTSADG